jgi:cytochrome c-type biogenesis protein CcmH
MLLWVVFAVLTAAAALAVVWPYWRRRHVGEDPPSDLAVYKQQLAELDGEQARGLLEEAEAQAARVEISRRILSAANAADNGDRSGASPIVPYIIVAVLAGLSMGTYLYFGSPQMPDQPLSARVAPQNTPSIDELVARVEERLRAHPEDGKGWSVIAHVYLRMGRFEEAINAYRKTIELLGSTPDRQADLGEALTLANDGVVTKDASTAFAAALSANPEDRRAEYWLAAEKEQTGDLAEAAKRYRALLGRGLQEDVRKMVAQRLSDVEMRLGEGSGAAGATTDQRAMIDSMVSGLAERLKADGSDLEGWLKLMRAYTVLGRRQDALDAMQQANAHFAQNQEALARIKDFAKSLGLET